MSFIIIIFQFSEQKKRIQLSQIGPSVPQSGIKNVPWQLGNGPDRTWGLSMSPDLLVDVKWVDRDKSSPDDCRLKCGGSKPAETEKNLFRADVKLCWRQWQDLLQLKYLKIQTSSQIFHFQEQKMQFSFSLNSKRIHFWLYLKNPLASDKTFSFNRFGMISSRKTAGLIFAWNSSECGDLDSSNYLGQYSSTVHSPLLHLPGTFLISPVIIFLVGLPSQVDILNISDWQQKCIFISRQ